MKIRKISIFLLLFAALFSIPKGQNEIEPSQGKSRAMEALQFWSEHRAYPSGRIPDAKITQEFDKFQLRSLNKTGSQIPENSRWESIGPANRGGRTLALAVDPLNPSRVYAGSASGGLWRLTWQNDEDYFWHNIDTGFPVLGVGAITINPQNSDEIYIGTGEVYDYRNVDMGMRQRMTRGSYGIGVLKTTDGGATWEKTLDWAYEENNGVQALEINPHDPSIVFAGTSEGLYRTDNSGETWQRVLDVKMIVDIAINHLNPDIIFASAGNFETENKGIYRSMDGGSNWTNISEPYIADWTGKALIDIYKKDPNIIFVDLAETFFSIGLFRSEDSGDTWEQVTQENADWASYQGWFAHYVRVNPEDEEKIILAGVRFFRSEDGGARLVQDNQMHVDHHAFANHPTDPEVVYFGNDGGVYISKDGGTTIREINQGYVTSQFYKGFSSSATNNILALGGLQDNGTIMYTGSENWLEDRLPGGDGAYNAIHPYDNDLMFASWQYLNIMRSENMGYTWVNIKQQITWQNYTNAAFVAPYLLAPSNPDIMYAGTDFLHRSDNMGVDWQVMNHGFSVDRTPIMSIAISPSDAEVVYFATSASYYQQPQLYVSTDGGRTIENITAGLPARYIRDIKVTESNRAYIVLSGFGSSHVFTKDNQSKTWIDIDRGELPDLPTSAFMIDPYDENILYVGNDLGVFVSFDQGGSWERFGNGMNSAALIMDFSISPIDNMLRAVTHGNGVYEVQLLSVGAGTSGNKVREYQLFQNYPNPFNPETNITFSLSKDADVELSIYSIVGKKVATIADGIYSLGIYRIAWDGTNNHGQQVAAGVYIYRLTTENKTLSKKMVVIR